MTERRRRDVVTPLLLALTVILVLAFQVFRPFLLIFAVAASVALLLAPVHGRLSAALGRRSILAASLIVLVTTLAIFVPLVTSLLVLAQQALAFFDWVRPHLEPAELDKLWDGLVAARFPALGAWLERGESRLAPLVSGALGQLAGGLNTLLQGLLAGFAHTLFDLFLFLIFLFFLLCDGARLRSELRPISPFTESQERQIFDHLGKTVKGALQSMIVVPLVQGVMAGLGFLMLGVPSPLVWGGAVILAAMVPILGSPLAWLPACFYLFFTGQSGRAGFMLLYGIVVISGIDNVIKPMLLRGSAQIHPLLGFLSILGGVLAFGVSGFLVGPVILSLVLSAIRIYRMDVLRPQEAPPPDRPPPLQEPSPEALSTSAS